MTKTAHSTYWLGDDWLERLPPRGTPEYAFALSSVRRSVADFVRIVTKQDIPVKFSSGQQSYTDGRSVIISAAVKPAQIDVIVGLALHEASHIKLSQPLFTWMRNVFNGVTPLPRTANNRELWEINPAVLERDRVPNKLQLIINLIEDRRIDSWMYENIGGYRPYYDRLYEAYFYSPVINKALQDPAWRTPYLASYELHLINMTNKLATPDALPELDKIWKLIDLKNIRRFDKNPLDIVNVAVNVLEIVLRNAVPGEPKNPAQNPDQMQDGSGSQDSQDGSDSQDGQDEQDLDNLDYANDSEGSESATQEKKQGKPGRPKKGDNSKQSVTKVMLDLDKQKNFINGALDKSPLDVQTAQQVEQLEHANAIIKPVGQGSWRGKKIDVLIYRKITKTVADLGCPFVSNRTVTNDAVSAGILAGNILAYRVRVLQDEYRMTFNRQEHGKLDRRRIAALGHGDANVFERTQDIRHTPVLLHVSVDASGSMQSLWTETVKFMTMLATAALKTRNFNVVISLRAGTNRGNLRTEVATVSVIFDSRTDGMAKVRDLFPRLCPEGSTPEGLAFEAIHDSLIMTEKNVRKYFVNISDGMPMFNGYYGDVAIRHTREQIQKMRQSGVRILSYLVGNSGGTETEDFKQMYGKDAAFINTESIPQIAATLNRLFLQED